MVNIELFLKEFLQKLDETFPNRIWFVGLQGSYARGEATETSDLDVVVILDELTAEDLERYSAMLDTLPQRELICGFVAGRRELMNWEASDLFQFYHDTLPIRGSLDELLPKLDAAAVNRAVYRPGAQLHGFRSDGTDLGQFREFSQLLPGLGKGLNCGAALQ